MKIYVIKGFGYNAAEAMMETYAIVCTSREEVEKQLDMIIEEQVMMAKSDAHCGIDYVETVRKRNGLVSDYTIDAVFDMRKVEHQEAFLWSTLVIGGNIGTEEFQPALPDDGRPKLRIMRQTSLQIRSQEIGTDMGENSSEELLKHG